MRLLFVPLLAGMTLLTGCAAFLDGMANSGITYDPNRTYNQFPLPTTPQTIQPNFQGPAIRPNGQYQTITVNTPNGLVTKQCTMLSSGQAYCF
jgi:hypothetical protein